MDIILLVVYLLIALVFSFMCSVFEAVLLSVRRPYIATQREVRPANAATWEKLLSDINRPLSAILILNTVAHTVGAAGVGAQAMKVFGDAPVTTGIISAVLTLLILVLSEIIPKTLGAVYWQQIAPVTGSLLTTLTRLMSPLIWITNLITSFLSGGKKKGAFSRAEFMAMADIGEEEGAIDPSEKRIVKNLFGLPDTPANSAATPRTVVFALPSSTTVGEFVSDHPEVPFSRIPIFDESLDHPTGFVLRLDILKAHAEGRLEAELGDLRRTLPAFSQSENLSTTFEKMISERFHIAAVVDEFGTFTGLITLEDVIETILGSEIVDEADTAEDMQQKARELWKQRAAKMGLPTEDL